MHRISYLPSSDPFAKRVNAYVEKAVKKVKNQSLFLTIKFDDSDPSVYARCETFPNGHKTITLQRQALLDAPLPFLRYIVYHEMGHAQDSTLYYRHLLPDVVASLWFVYGLVLSWFTPFLLPFSWLSCRWLHRFLHNIELHRSEYIAQCFAVETLLRQGDREAIGFYVAVLSKEGEDQVPSGFRTYPTVSETIDCVLKLAQSYSRKKEY